MYVHTLQSSMCSCSPHTSSNIIISSAIYTITYTAHPLSYVVHLYCICMMALYISTGINASYVYDHAYLISCVCVVIYRNHLLYHSMLFCYRCNMFNISCSVLVISYKLLQTYLHSQHYQYHMLFVNMLLTHYFSNDYV